VMHQQSLAVVPVTPDVYRLIGQATIEGVQLLKLPRIHSASNGLSGIRGNS
jgi:hypothetical protein